MLNINSECFKADFFEISSECEFDGTNNKSPTKILEDDGKE